MKKKINLLLKNFLEEKIKIFFSEKKNIDDNIIDRILFKMDKCFSGINRKYYKKSLKNLDLNNSDHLCQIFYFAGNISFNLKKDDLAKNFFILNKIYNGLDLFYSVKLPKIFLFCHPLSSVIGNARYSDYTVFFQNVTIGRKKKYYPTFGKGIIFYPGSVVVGNCKVGDNTIFAPNSSIIDTNIPKNSIVIGKYPNLIIKKNKNNVIEHFFKSYKNKIYL